MFIHHGPLSVSPASIYPSDHPPVHQYVHSFIHRSIHPPIHSFQISRMLYSIVHCSSRNSSVHSLMQCTACMDSGHVRVQSSCTHVPSSLAPGVSGVFNPDPHGLVYVNELYVNELVTRYGWVEQSMERMGRWMGRWVDGGWSAALELQCELVVRSLAEKHPFINAIITMTIISVVIVIIIIINIIIIIIAIGFICYYIQYS